MAVLAFQAEFRRSDQSRFNHRLHAVLLVAQGMTCRQAGHMLGDAPRTVEYWVRAYSRTGLAGLQEGARPGRPPRLTDGQIKVIRRVLRCLPGQFGLTANLWDGKALAAYVLREFYVVLGVRQCQRLLKTLDFRLRKPGPEVAHTGAGRQQRHKKGSRR